MTNRIRELRKQKNMTQKQLAEAAHVHRVLIAKYETTGMMPQLKTARKIAESLGVTIDALIGGADDYDEKRHSGLLEE